jgi:hypothetical protein
MEHKMTIFAIVKNKKVTNNVICESLELLQLLLPTDTLIEETELTGFAWIGSDVIGAKFKPPQPFDSWSFDSKAFIWKAPTAMPKDGKPYYWNESELAWVEIVPVETTEPEATPE